MTQQKSHYCKSNHKRRTAIIKANQDSSKTKRFEIKFIICKNPKKKQQQKQQRQTKHQRQTSSSFKASPLVYPIEFLLSSRCNNKLAHPVTSPFSTPMKPFAVAVHRLHLRTFAVAVVPPVVGIVGRKPVVAVVDSPSGYRIAAGCRMHPAADTRHNLAVAGRIHLVAGIHHLLKTRRVDEGVG